MRLSGLGAGVSTAQAIGMAAPIASAGTSAATAAALGAWAGPVGAAVGALIGIIAGLWAAHAARAAGAKTENQALNSALTAFDSSLRAVFQAANSGQVTGAQAAQVCLQILQQFWQTQAPYMTGAGRADSSGGGANCGTVNPSAPCSGMIGGHKCDKKCTATCCVGCQDLAPTIAQAISVLSSPTGGTVTVCNVAGSGYGATARGSYTLTYTPPAGLSAAGVASSLASGSGSSLFLLVALGGVAYLAMR